MLCEKRFIEIPELKRSARLYIGLPAGYADSGKRYPVLYMHDGHNIFFDEDSFGGCSWGMLEAYQEDPTLPEIIIVAMECAEGIVRLDEYCPFPIHHEAVRKMEPNRVVGGDGYRYLEYLSKGLKPIIDEKYRTKPEAEFTGIMGSSMGGLISLFAGLAFQDTFSRIGSVSGSYFVALNPLLQSVEAADLSRLNKLYMDVGTSEAGIGMNQEYIIANQKVYAALSEKMGSSRLRFEIIEGAIHHESAWRKRLPDILKYLFQG